MVTTSLYEQARDLILENLKLNKDKFVVIFCSPLRLKLIKSQLKSAKLIVFSSQAIGLPLGIRALVVKKSELISCNPVYSGGGMIKMVYPNSLILADLPDRFEAGTPSIVNAITLVKALQVLNHFGNENFNKHPEDNLSVEEILYKDELLPYTGKKLLTELRETLIGHKIRVPTITGEKPYINLDNGASTPTFIPIWDVITKTWKQPEHIQRDIVSEVKRICTDFLDASLEEFDVIFTANTTEAINLVAQNLHKGLISDIDPVVVNTLIEHHSNELPWRELSGASLIRLMIDDKGFVNLKELERVLRDYNQKHKYEKKRIVIVAVSGASNVLGSFDDIQEISRITHKYKALLLVDGAQLVAHRKVSMKATGIDFLAFSGHKIYAPFGSGALIVRKELLNFSPAELTEIKSSGEENLTGIAAMGKAITILERVGMDVIEAQERLLTRNILHGLNKMPNIKIFGIKNPESSRFNRKGGTIVFNLKNVPHNLVAKELAEYGGIGVRNGCFCANMLVKHLLRINPIRVFAAKLGLMQIPTFTSKVLPGLVRVSIGIENDEKEVRYFVQILECITRKSRSHLNKFIGSIDNGTFFLPPSETAQQINDFVDGRVKKVFS